MHRLFLPEDWITQGKVAITGKLVHRLRDVLRLGVGDHIAVLDNSGWEYEVELSLLDSGKVEGMVVSKILATGEPLTRIIMYQALLKGGNFEVVLQKCTEVGVTGFVPIVCERCVAGEPGSSRLSRWKSVILEAAEQSRRGKRPVLHNVITFNEACKSTSGISLLPWEGESVKGIGGFLRSRVAPEKTPEINIFIGPEGGFSPREVEFARSCGIVPVSLGRRILRAETAGLVAAALTLYELGEMDGNP
jgi:16S rRNA (uracil1498-N3)-methyltransferase